MRLGPNIHSPGDGEEIILVEKIALEDEGVKAEIAKLKLPEGTVVISDPWIYGEQSRRACSVWSAHDTQGPMGSTMTSACISASYTFGTQ